MFENITIDEINKMYATSIDQVNNQLATLNTTCDQFTTPTLGQLTQLRASFMEIYNELDFQLAILHELNNVFTDDMIVAKIGETILIGKLISKQTGLHWSGLDHWVETLKVDGV